MGIAVKVRHFTHGWRATSRTSGVPGGSLPNAQGLWSSALAPRVDSTLFQLYIFMDGCMQGRYWDGRVIYYTGCRIGYQGSGISTTPVNMIFTSPDRVSAWEYSVENDHFRDYCCKSIRQFTSCCCVDMSRIEDQGYEEYVPDDSSESQHEPPWLHIIQWRSLGIYSTLVTSCSAPHEWPSACSALYPKTLEPMTRLCSPRLRVFTCNVYFCAAGMEVVCVG